MEDKQNIEFIKKIIKEELSKPSGAIHDNLKKLIQETAKQEIRLQLRSGFFTDQKLTDTPKDRLSVVNRNYVNLSGTVANRPSSILAVQGQHYFATDLNTPIVFSGSNWRNGVGSIVAGA